MKTQLWISHLDVLYATVNQRTAMRSQITSLKCFPLHLLIWSFWTMTAKQNEKASLFWQADRQTDRQTEEWVSELEILKTEIERAVWSKKEYTEVRLLQQ
jgi:hypothetical protein